MPLGCMQMVTEHQTASRQRKNSCDLARRCKRNAVSSRSTFAADGATIATAASPARRLPFFFAILPPPACAAAAAVPSAAPPVAAPFAAPGSCGPCA